MDEYLDGLVEIRGQFDGQRIQAQSYVHLLNDICTDFGIRFLHLYDIN